MVVKKSLMLVKTIKWIAVTIICLLMLWIVGRVLLFDTFIISTSSMEPSLLPGDMIIVNKTIMGPRIYTDFHFELKRSYR